MFNRKYTDQDMAEAVSKATATGYQLGYLKAITDVNSILDTHGYLIGLKPTQECLAVKQAMVILQKEEDKKGEL